MLESRFSLFWLLFFIDISIQHSIMKPKETYNSISEVRTVHISFGNKTNQICILWCSTNLDYDKNIPPRVRYGFAKSLLSQISIGKTVQFNSAKKRFFHRVVLSNLLPENTYYYQIIRQNKSNSYLDPIESFTVPQSPTSSSITQSFLVFADMGTRSGGIPYVVQESINNRYTSIFHIGDIAYNLASNDGIVGDIFLSKLKNMVSRIPYLTVPGDHESFDNYEHYRHRFSVPNQDWPALSNQLWYSLDIGVVHVISLETEHFMRNDLAMKDQLDWLKNDLIKANANREQVPWIFVLAHRPLYCSAENLMEDCASDNSKVRAALEKILFTYGVDLILSGHEHCYERTWPIYQKRVLAYNYKDAPGPVHIVIGTFGYNYIVDSISSFREHWSAFATTQHKKESFGRLNVFNKSHVFWEVFYVNNNQLMDRMWLIKSKHGPYSLKGIFPDKSVYAARHMSLEELNNLSQTGAYSEKVRTYILYIFMASGFLLLYLTKKHIYVFCTKKLTNRI
ncbi:acid phosphatase type 7-like [Octopus sinensis]|uniref:Purple acid phosphatase n=1 Tax=Octopus sinensis TaxID=2607531 RepID=A0A6P7SZX3_9MOLL|nr:acid phosphatase type 7-like [Octopus sinensis]